MVRFFWVGFLVCSYTPLPGIRVSLLILCIYFGVSEVQKGIMFHKAKDSYLIGKNPKIIHNYVERIMFQDDLHTTPMDICDYIVMGDENHEIDICGNGYILGKKKSNSKGIITIGRVFQFNSSEDEAFTLAHPYWRDVCLSFSLAKMLRRRFAKLLEDEAKCRNFVLEGIIDYIGKNRDIQTNRNDGERNPTRRVFTIIQQELEYVSEFLHLRVPISHYFEDYTMVDLASIPVIFGNGVYLIYTISKRSSVWLSLLVEKAYTHCLFNGFRRGSMVVKIFSRLDLAITILLVFACIYIQYTGSSFVLNSPRWSSLKLVERYIKDPTKWNISHNSLVASKSYKLHSQLLNRMVVVVQRAYIKKVQETRVHHSFIVDLETETIFFCIKVDGSILACLPKWARRIIPTSSPTVICSIDAKEAILKSLRKSGGGLTNGETSLKKHRIDHLNWACLPHAHTTETILVWNIATTLFHNHNTLAHQNNDFRHELAPEQNNNPFKKEQEVALVLSNYCHYLVKYLPDLLPDEIDWKETMYERVKKDILDIDMFFDKKPTKEMKFKCLNLSFLSKKKTKPTKEYRCNYVLHAMWPESSVVGKGAMLAKDLIKCAEDDEAHVWMMLADFCAEMMLFIAPSDNIDGHEKLLDRNELITQLWALLTLTHAGIITRPKLTKHQDHHSESNAVTGDMNV